MEPSPASGQHVPPEGASEGAEACVEEEDNDEDDADDDEASPGADEASADLLLEAFSSATRPRGLPPGCTAIEAFSSANQQRAILEKEQDRHRTEVCGNHEISTPLKPRRWPPVNAFDADCQHGSPTSHRWRRMMGARGGITGFIEAHPETFQRRVRRGIPAELRWEVWKAAVGIEKRMRPGLYQDLLRVENRWTKAIEIDIPRTFPDIPAFGVEQQQMLLRILHAYANLNPDIGYCQGMNFVGGLLLLLSENEEESFWMLVCLMDEGKLSGFYENQFPLLRRYLRAFDRLVAEMVPDLREHFVRENVQPAVYLHQWFLTLYINCLPLPMVLVFWDVIVCSGLEELLPITVSLLRVLKNMLLGLQFEDIVRFFKVMRGGEDECDMVAVGQRVVAKCSDIDIPPYVDEILRTDAQPSENWDSEERWSPEQARSPRGDATARPFAWPSLELPQGVLGWWEDARQSLQLGVSEGVT